MRIIKNICIVLLMCLCMSPLAAQNVSMGLNAPTLMKSSVKKMYAAHPQMRLQDFYKSFYQDRFGPEHLIKDTASAKAYLQRELQTPDTGGLLFEKVGMYNHFVRVYLRAVQENLITADELYRAFVGSMGMADLQKRKNTWKEEWKQLQDVIEQQHLPIADLEADKARIAKMMRDKGDAAVSHSDAYRKAYHPAYRIVHRTLFEEQILPKLRKDKVVLVYTDPDADKEPLEQYLSSIKAVIIYDYKLAASGLAVRVPDALSVPYVMTQLGRIEGVLSVERDSAAQMH